MSGVKVLGIHTFKFHFSAGEVTGFYIIFQEAIKENSVTMNKMRVLKNKMESQKNMKVGNWTIHWG